MTRLIRQDGLKASWPQTNRLRTFSDLGFAVGAPQAPAAPADFDGFCTQLNGGTDMTISEVSRVRRLHFEACTLIVAHTKQQVTLDANVEGSRKLPAAEKQARLQQQQARLSGLHIAGELQPSHSLIDLAASMLESNTIIWIGPSKCTKGNQKYKWLLRRRSLRCCPLNNRQ